MLHYNYQRKNRRGLGLTLKLSHRGRLIVSAPRFTPEFMIRQFVQSQGSWINKQKAKLKKRQTLLTQAFVYIFGKKYQLKLANLNQTIGGFFVIGDNLIYQPPSTITTIQQKQLPPKTKLEKFLKNTAANYLYPRTHQLAQKMGLQFKRITLKQQKSRWGSCSSQKNLNFNWRLVHFQPKVIDYVIIHELAHLVHLNHSAQFWALVAKFDGDYKEHKKILNRAKLD